MSTEWDAATYDRIADPQERWGRGVLERLRLAGGERVVDAGCGSGRVTELLAERLPAGEVVALDASAAMIAEAQRRLARFGDRVDFVVADLLDPLPVDPVDAVFSTATFHWITDHERLFRNLAAVLRPGGQLVAQSGGRGNIARVLAVLDEVPHAGGGAFLFAGPEETRERLEAAGFVEVETWLSEEPTRLEPGEPFQTYLRTVILRTHLARLSAEEHDAFVREVAERLGEPLIDYVRLNIVAARRRKGHLMDRLRARRPVPCAGGTGSEGASAGRVRGPPRVRARLAPRRASPPGSRPPARSRSAPWPPRAVSAAPGVGRLRG